MTKFKLGDKVTVVDSGKLYSTFDHWASQHGLKNWVSATYCKKDDEGTVVAIGSHSYDCESTIVVAVEIEGKDYIIGAEGLEKVDERTPAQKAGLVIGEKYYVSESSYSDAAGKVVVFHKDDASTRPIFKLVENVSAGSRSYYPYISEVNTYVEPVKTPAEEAGLIIGNKYFVSESAEGTGAKGKVVTFYRDDQSENPAFKGEDGEVYFPLIKYVTPYVEKVKTPAEQAGLVVGKQYFVVESVSAGLVNEVVTFKMDDATSRPKFELKDGTHCWPYVCEVSEYVGTTIVFDKILTQEQIDAIKTLVA